MESVEVRRALGKGHWGQGERGQVEAEALCRRKDISMDMWLREREEIKMQTVLSNADT